MCEVRFPKEKVSFATHLINVFSFTLQVEFAPTLKKLAAIVSNTCLQLTSTVSFVSRLPDLLTRRKCNKEASLKTRRPSEVNEVSFGRSDRYRGTDNSHLNARNGDIFRP